jgi:hypothetical protein
MVHVGAPSDQAGRAPVEPDRAAESGLAADVRNSLDGTIHVFGSSEENT